MTEREPIKKTINIPKTSEAWNDLFAHSKQHILEIEVSNNQNSGAISILSDEEIFSYIMLGLYDALKKENLIDRDQFLFDFELSERQIAQISEYIENISENEDTDPNNKVENSFEDIVDIFKMHEPRLANLEENERFATILSERIRLRAEKKALRNKTGDIKLLELAYMGFPAKNARTWSLILEESKRRVALAFGVEGETRTVDTKKFLDGLALDLVLIGLHDSFEEEGLYEKGHFLFDFELKGEEIEEINIILSTLVSLYEKKSEQTEIPEMLHARVVDIIRNYDKREIKKPTMDKLARFSQSMAGLAKRIMNLNPSELDQQVIGELGESPNTYVQMSMAYESLHKSELAIKAMRKAVELDAQHFENTEHLLRLLAESGDYEALSEALNASPIRGEKRLLLMILYSEKREVDKLERDIKNDKSPTLAIPAQSDQLASLLVSAAERTQERATGKIKSPLSRNMYLDEILTFLLIELEAAGLFEEAGHFTFSFELKSEDLAEINHLIEYAILTSDDLDIDNRSAEDIIEQNSLYSKIVDIIKKYQS